MLVGAAFFWGTNPMIMKVGMRELHPIPFNALRLSVGLLAAGVLLLLTRSWRPVQPADLPRFLLVGVAGFFLFQLCYSFGAPLNARKIGANAMALFSKNQRQWKAKPLSEESIRAFKTNLKQADIQPKR
jgi:drug/metabolite transporter (DMT)-like permease